MKKKKAVLAFFTRTDAITPAALASPSILRPLPRLHGSVSNLLLADCSSSKKCMPLNNYNETASKFGAIQLWSSWSHPHATRSSSCCGHSCRPPPLQLSHPLQGDSTEMALRIIASLKCLHHHYQKQPLQQRGQ